MHASAPELIHWVDSNMLSVMVKTIVKVYTIDAAEKHSYKFESLMSSACYHCGFSRILMRFASEHAKACVP